MNSGYKLLWTSKSIDDLKNIIDYLEKQWTEKEIKKFIKILDNRLELIKTNPKLFPQTYKRKNVRKSVLTKQIVLYYKTENETIIILTLFDTRQNPQKLKI